MAHVARHDVEHGSKEGRHGGRRGEGRLGAHDPDAREVGQQCEKHDPDRHKFLWVTNPLEAGNGGEEAERACGEHHGLR